MSPIIPETIALKHKLIGIVAIIISIVTWWVDISGVVYECPYCRTQRTVIGVLGGILLIPVIKHWFVKLIALEIGLFGFIVGAIQHFRGWAKIWSGEFKLNATPWTDPTVLSAVGMFIILFLTIVAIQPTSNE